ncbi:Potassium voltage-gated channel sub H member 5, partial [Perkinsus olseni]
MIFQQTPLQVEPEERLCEVIAGIARASLRAEQTLLPALEDEASLLNPGGESSHEKATSGLMKMSTQLALGLGGMGDFLEIITDAAPGKVALTTMQSMCMTLRELTAALAEGAAEVGPVIHDMDPTELHARLLYPEASEGKGIRSERKMSALTTDTPTSSLNTSVPLPPVCVSDCALLGAKVADATEDPHFLAALDDRISELGRTLQHERLLLQELTSERQRKADKEAPEAPKRLTLPQAMCCPESVELQLTARTNSESEVDGTLLSDGELRDRWASVCGGRRSCEGMSSVSSIEGSSLRDIGALIELHRAKDQRAYERREEFFWPQSKRRGCQNRKAAGERGMSGKAGCRVLPHLAAYLKATDGDPSFRPPLVTTAVLSVLRTLGTSSRVEFPKWDATPDKAWESDVEARSPPARWFVKHRNEAGIFLQRVGDADAPVRLERLTEEPRREDATRGGDPIPEGDLRSHLAKVSGRLTGAKSEEELRAAVASVMGAGIGWMEGVQTALTTAEKTLQMTERVRVELREAFHFGGIHEMGEALTAARTLWEPALDDRAFNELVRSVQEKLGRLTEERREMARQYMSEAKRSSSTMAAIPAWFLLKDALARLRQTGASSDILMEAESAMEVVSGDPLKISKKQVPAAAAELMKDDATQRAVLQCDQWLDTNHATLRERSIVMLHVGQLRRKAIRRLRSAIERHLWGYAEADCAIAHAVQDARDVGASQESIMRELSPLKALYGNMPSPDERGATENLNTRDMRTSLQALRPGRRRAHKSEPNLRSTMRKRGRMKSMTDAGRKLVQKGVEVIARQVEHRDAQQLTMMEQTYEGFFTDFDEDCVDHYRAEESIIGGRQKIGDSHNLGGAGLSVLATGQASLATLYGSQRAPESKQAEPSAAKSPGLLDRVKETLQGSECFVWPDSRFRRTWDLILLVLILYQAVTVPLLLAFPYMHLSGGYKLFEDIVTVFFLLDVLVNFCTGYQRPNGVIEMGAKEVALHYLKGWFLLDLLASFPYSWIITAAAGTDSAASRGPNLLRIIRVGRIARGLKLVRVLKLKGVMDGLSESLGGALVESFAMTLIGMAKFSVLVLLIAHWNACAFGMVGWELYRAGSENWMYRLEYAKGAYPTELVTLRQRPCVDGETAELQATSYTNWDDYTPGGRICVLPDVYEAYLQSMFWSLQTIAAVGYGNVYGWHWGERLYSIIAMLLGCAAFGLTVGYVSTD